MKRFLGIIVIILFLAVICITEELLVGETISEVKKICTELTYLSTITENVDDENIVQKTNALANFWKEKEKFLCFFINYKDMGEMCNEIVKMQSYAINNIKEEYTTSLALVNYYCNTFDHLTGFTLQNIF